MPWKVVERILDNCEADLRVMCRLLKTSRFLRTAVTLYYLNRLHSVLRRQGVAEPAPFLCKLDLYQALLSGPDMLDIIFKGSVPKRKFISRMEIHIPDCPGYLRELIDDLEGMGFEVQHRWTERREVELNGQLWLEYDHMDVVTTELVQLRN